MAVNDFNIRRFANILTKQHGEGAAIHAAMKADELLMRGEQCAHAVENCVHQ